MRAPRVARHPGRAAAALALVVAALVVALAPPALAQLRIGDLDVSLNNHEVTVHTVLLDALPTGFGEGLVSGLPARLRFTVELWQYSRFWMDRLLTTRVVERQLAYHLVSKEYRVTSVRGETRPPYVSRDLRDAQRVLSELTGLTLTPAGTLDPAGIIYVRVSAQVALGGENTFFTRLSGTAAQTVRQSDYRPLLRVQ